MVLATTVRIILILAVAIMIGPSLAYGSPGCMTQSEARAKFPKAHLFYVHGSEHCWTASAAYDFRSLPAVAVHSPRPLPAVPAPSPRPALAAAPVPFSRPEIVNSGIDEGVIDAGAQCQYSPCE